MKILLPIRRVIDHSSRVRVEYGAVVTKGVRMSINPYDENALEAAIELREAGKASEVIAVIIGDAKSELQLRDAIAIGADSAVRVDFDGKVYPLEAARILKDIARDKGAGLILTGKQDTDSDDTSLGGMLASLLDWPCATGASSISIDNGKARVTREIDGGTQDIEMSLPSVITCDLNLNIPRKAKLPAVIEAKKAAIEQVCVNSNNAQISTLSVREPLPRVGAQKKLKNVDELASVIKSIVD